MILKLLEWRRILMAKVPEEGGKTQDPSPSQGQRILSPLSPETFMFRGRTKGGGE